MDIQKDHIGNIVAADYRTAAVFKKYGIDFCCKGGRTVEEATAEKGIDAEDIYQDLSALPKGGEADIDFKAWPLDLLADYIEKTHHRYVREKSPILMEFLTKLCQVHGERHPELYEIRALFEASVQDLGDHMLKEDQILFPFVRTMVEAKSAQAPFVQPNFGTVENPIQMMMHEHTAEGERFEKIAALTDGYTPPADACNTYKVAFKMLEEFENDLHRHIHLENNILFPESIAMERTMVDG